MRPLPADEIRGNWATLLLPIQADEGIDHGCLADEIDYLVAAGVDGIYSNGTAGEFYTQTEDEFDRISTLLAERCERGGIPFQIGASHMSPQLSLSRIRRAVKLKPSAIQVILSDWKTLNDDEVVDCLQRFAAAAQPVGLVLYNPPHAKRVLEPPIYARLRQAVPELVGIKVADGDDDWYAQMRQHAAGLSIFVPGHHLIHGLPKGAHGAYSNVACLQPIGAQKLVELAQTDYERALGIETRLQAFMTQHIAPYIQQQGYANQAVDKLLAGVGNWAEVGTRLRWPYRWIDSADAERLRPIARAAVPELFTCENGY
ncbi:MAG: dihydrodipicolinate synthase family protein [Anaerolineae bacterium]|nr:dihydrodipicolinate synthase family protein [Anaerolineae bacterium]